MLLFTIVELINKLLGLYITGYLARILPATTLGHYLSGLVMLGYALELAFFGAQNRNNADYAVHPNEYLDSRRFAARKTVTSFAVLASAIFLIVALRTTATEFSTIPLLVALVCVPVTFDFVAYGEGRTRVLVTGRFVSQLIAVGWITLVGKGVISPYSLYWGQLLQTASVTLLISFAMVSLGRVHLKHFAIGVTKFPSRGDELRTALVDQSVAFALRLTAMAAVSSELVLLNIVGDGLSSELATSLRLVQVISPFVIFYIDSRVRSVNDDGFWRYSIIIAAGAIGLVLGSPVLVRVLYGRAFMPMVADISAFAPAFVVQALCQFQLIATLKAGTERRLIRRLVIAVVLSSVALAILLATGGTLRELAMLYTIKAVVVALLLPTEQRNAKRLCVAIIVAAALLNVALYETGYYDAAARVLH